MALKSDALNLKISYRSLWDSLKTQKRDFWRANLYGIAATLLFLPIPILIPLLIDEILLEHPGKLSTFFSSFGFDAPWQIVFFTLMTVILLRAVVFLLNNAKTFYALRITQKSAYTLRHTLLHHLEHLRIGEFETLKSGEVVSRSVQDVENISGFIGSATTTLLTAGLTFAGVLGVMFYISWPLALMVLVLNPLFLGFSRLIGKRAARLWRRQSEAYGDYQDLMTETLELFVQVRASHREKTFFDLLKSKAFEIKRASLDYGYKSSVAQSSSNLLTNTVVDIFRALGILAVAYTDLSIGMMLAFLFYLSTITQPVQQLMGLVISFQSAKPSIERLSKLLSMETEPHYPHEVDPFKGNKTVSVELDNITFTYAKGKKILDNISIKAEAGEKIALIGPSGSGKSTIAQLLVGFYEPSRGAVCYGDIPMEKIGLPVVRENVALMLQESLFFNDTIRMNLTLGRTMSDTKIYKALVMAQLDTFVQSLEKGLDALIGKNGIRLSGGQRQRLAIARLILSDPKVVIFDEATSALDGETEHRLYASLNPFLQGRTIIIIAHRDTTIRQAERIYFIESGRVRAKGTYAALREKGMIKEEYEH
jgi:ATP-binding cassette subfamily C protein